MQGSIGGNNISGQVNNPVTLVEYKGGSTDTASVSINSKKKLITVDVKKLPTSLTIEDRTGDEVTNIVFDGSEDKAFILKDWTLKEVEPQFETSVLEYSLIKDGNEIGDRIRIPKDRAITSIILKFVDADSLDKVKEQCPEARIGDPYLDLTVQNSSQGHLESHLYVLMIGVVDIYTPGHALILNKSEDEQGRKILTFNVDPEIIKQDIDLEGINRKFDDIETYFEGVDESLNELHEGIEQEIADRKEAINIEATARDNADLELQQNIDTEQARAQREENDIRVNLSEEISNREIAVSDLTKSLAEETSLRKSSDKTILDNLSNEITRAEKAESNLTTDLNSEINRAKESENSLNGLINDETSRATAKETSIENLLNNETTRAQNVEAGLQASLNTEITNRTNGDIAALSSAKSYADEIVSEEAADREKIDNQIIKTANQWKEELDNNISTLNSSLENEITTRKSEDSSLSDRLTDVEHNYIKKDGSVSMTGNLSLGTSDSRNRIINVLNPDDDYDATNKIYVDGSIETLSENELAARQQLASSLQKLINDEASLRLSEDTIIREELSSETTNRKAEDEANLINAKNYTDEKITSLTQSLNEEISNRQSGDSGLDTRITTETKARASADTNLQEQIDAITSASDVVDIVATKADLNSYDTSSLTDKDIIKVLKDESQDNKTTYYRFSKSTSSFTLIGGVGPYYTMSEIDDKTNTIKANISAIDIKLDTEISNRTSGDTNILTSAKSYTDTKISDEQTARTTADNNLQSNINTKVNKTTTIAGLDLGNDITKDKLLEALGFSFTDV